MKDETPQVPDPDEEFKDWQANPEAGTMPLPLCPKCEKPMIFCMAIPFKEFVCIPCGTSEEFLCEKVDASIAEHDAKIELYKDDIHALACGNGAMCNLTLEDKDCPICEQGDKYEYKYYLKGQHGA